MYKNREIFDHVFCLHFLPNYCLTARLVFTLRLCFPANKELQTWQARDLLPVWIFIWFLRVLFTAKLLSHLSQGNGFSPVWVLRFPFLWIRKLCLTIKIRWFRYRLLADCREITLKYNCLKRDCFIICIIFNWLMRDFLLKTIYSDNQKTLKKKDNFKNQVITYKLL